MSHNLPKNYDHCKQQLTKQQTPNRLCLQQQVYKWIVSFLDQTDVYRSIGLRSMIHEYNPSHQPTFTKTFAKTQ